jgi:hypothetical protein
MAELPTIVVGRNNWGIKAGNLLGYYESDKGFFVKREFAVTRASIATRVNEDGFIEAPRTNLALQSENFTISPSPWSPNNVTVSPNVTGTTDPFGTFLADEVFETTTNSNHFLAQTMSITSGTTYTGSIFLKKSPTSPDWIQIAFSTTGLAGFANFDLTNETIGNIHPGCTANIEDYGNGWYRCSLTQTANASGTSGGPVIVFVNNTNPANRYVSYTGNSSTSIYVFGAQFEEYTIATPYIPTTTVARTTFGGITVDGTSANNIPRVDHTGNLRALLVEPSATNRMFPSTEIYAWQTFVSGGATQPTSIQAKDVIDPLGGRNSTIVNGGNGSVGSWGVYQLISGYASGDTVTYSVFAKKGTHNILGLQHANVSITGAQSAFFDLNNGTSPTPGAIMQDYGNGWYRCIMPPITFTTTPPGAYNIGHYVAQSISTYVWSTNYLDKNIYLLGGQIELGSVATSYIPTTVAAVTRDAENVTLASATNYIGQTEGTIYAEVILSRVNPNYVISFGTLNDRIMINFDSSTSVYALIRVGGVNADYTATIPAIPATGGVYKIALAYKANDYCFAVNGVTYASTASRGVPANMSALYLGASVFSTAQFNDRIIDAEVYNTRLDNGELMLLTSPIPYDNVSDMIWETFIARTSTFSELPDCLRTRHNEIIES